MDGRVSAAACTPGASDMAPMHRIRASPAIIKRRGLFTKPILQQEGAGQGMRFWELYPSDAVFPTVVSECGTGVLPDVIMPKVE
jgi:hypothetical protein